MFSPVYFALNDRFRCPRCIHWWFVGHVSMVHQSDLIFEHQNRDREADHQLSKRFPKTDTLPPIKRTKSHRVSHSTIRAFVEFWFGVESFRDEPMWLLPLGGIMLQIVKRNNNWILLSFISHPLNSHILVEARWIWVNHRCFDSKCLEVTLPKIA